MHSILTYLLLVTAVASAAPSADNENVKAQTIRFTQVFTEPNEVGPYEDFFDYAPDLSLHGIDNKIVSAFQTGFWIYYDLVNYEGENCWTYGISTSFDSFEADCNGVASSLRYAGNPDELNGDYVNLYEGDFFTGAEFRTNVTSIGVGNLDQAVSSLIISGNSAWTFFTGSQFGGAGICLAPDEHFTHEDGTVLDFNRVYQMADMGLPDNSIRSILKGCLNPQVVPQHSSGKTVEADRDN